MSSGIPVFYVTATHAGAPKDERGEFARFEVAKFFAKADAVKHMERLPNKWVKVAIEERSEELAAQHVAHGGKVGAEEDKKK